MDQDPDAELLGRLRAGDEQAFVVLVRRHHAAMLRDLCRRWRADQGDSGPG